MSTWEGGRDVGAGEHIHMACGVRVYTSYYYCSSQNLGPEEEAERERESRAASSEPVSIRVEDGSGVIQCIASATWACGFPLASPARQEQTKQS